MEEQNTLDLSLQDDSELQGRYLTFWIDKQLFGIPITEVVQIVGMQKITELPEHPLYSKGFISLRGEIIPVIDVRLRFGKSEIPYDDRTCIVIIRVQGNNFGLIVDEVDEVTDILPEQISLPPQVSSEKINVFLTGIAQLNLQDSKKNKIVLLIDAAKILCEDEFEALTVAVQE